jgi:hypothetical protein
MRSDMFYILGDPNAAATPAADPHATKSRFSASWRYSSLYFVVMPKDVDLPWKK